MYTIATLHDIRQYLNLADEDTTSDEALLKALQQASHIVESVTHRRYCPHVESRIASIDLRHPTELILPDDLLSIESLTNGDGTVMSLDNVQLIPEHRDIPSSRLVLINGVSFVYSESAINAVSISGIWGWHDRWSQAWRDSDDTLNDNPLSANATTLAVSAANGADADGFSPRFQVGQLLKIDSEYLRVIAIDHATNQLTILRGVQGTSPSSHLQDTTIMTYQPVPAIRDLCIRYAELLFKSIGVFDTHHDPMVRQLRRLGA